MGARGRDEAILLGDLELDAALPPDHDSSGASGVLRVLFYLGQVHAREAHDSRELPGLEGSNAIGEDLGLAHLAFRQRRGGRWRGKLRLAGQKLGDLGHVGLHAGSGRPCRVGRLSSESGLELPLPSLEVRDERAHPRFRRVRRERVSVGGGGGGGGDWRGALAGAAFARSSSLLTDRQRGVAGEDSTSWRVTGRDGGNGHSKLPQVVDAGDGDFVDPGQVDQGRAVPRPDHAHVVGS